MKIQYKLAFIAAGLLAVSSCAKHDPIADNGELGQIVPTTYWSVGSTACKAGEDFSFQGKYYTIDPTATIDHSEVWYNIKRDESASATAKLAGSALKYTKTIAATDTVRNNQSVASFPHSEDYWSPLDNCYIINASVPTSVTLSPVSWKDVRTWDQEKFDTYYPSTFAKEFCDEVINQLTKDSTYYTGLKTVYVNYNFTNEQFAAVNAEFGTNFPTDINITSDPQSAVSDKSDRWYETTEADDAKVVGYYYKTVDANGNTVIIEVGKDQVTFDVDANGKELILCNGNKCYKVYDSAPWVFCRYDDDAGAIVRAVRAQYIPAFRSLLNTISFPEWIYDSAESVYSVTFSRQYKLDSQFKVYDSKGNVGIASDTRTIDIN